MAIWRQLPPEPEGTNSTLGEVVEEATKGLDRADKLCERAFTGVENLKKMVAAARKQLCGGATFYQDVSQDELESVIRAMKAELTTSTPTGHWYYCANGHPVSAPGRSLIVPKADIPIVHNQ